MKKTILLLCICSSIVAAAPPCTTVADQLSNPDGTPFTGRLVMDLGYSTPVSTGMVVQNSIRVQVKPAAAGAFSLCMVAGSYRVVYTPDGYPPYPRFWTVPTTGPVTVRVIETSTMTTLTSSPAAGGGGLFVKSIATPALVVAIPASEHGFLIGNFLWACFETSTGARIYPGSVTLGSPTPDLTLTFSRAVAASCRLWTGDLVPNYLATFTASSSVAIAAAQHHFQTAELAEQCYDNSSPRVGFRHGPATIDAGYNLTVSLSRTLTGVCVVGKR